MLVKELQNRGAKRPGTGYAFHYCSMDNAASQKATGLLGSVLAQLARLKPQMVDLISPLRVPGGSLTLNELEGLLVTGLGLFDRFYAVIDALNETPEQRTIMSSILRLCQRCPSFRVLATCTLDPFGGRTYISLARMTTDQVDRDLEIYVAHRLYTEQCFCLLIPSVKDAIRSAMTKGADGT